MTQTPVPQLILKLSVPTIISMLVTAIYNTADTFFVGRISTQATAAVGLVFTIMALIQAVICYYTFYIPVQIISIFISYTPPPRR